MATDSHWDDTVVLLPFNGANGSLAIVDEKKHRVVINGNAAISTAQYPTGATSSLLLDGNNDFINLVSGTSPQAADQYMWIADWCMEFPIYRVGDTTTATTNVSVLVDNRSSDAQDLELRLTGSGAADPQKIVVFLNNAIVITGTTVIGATWNWITLTRVYDGANYKLRLFINGVQEGVTFTDSSTNSNNYLFIGGRYAATGGDRRSFNGYIGPFRFTRTGRGLITTFTPPTLPYPVPTISGQVFDSTASPVAKTVVAYKEANGELVGGATSDAGTGAYSIKTTNFDEHNVVLVDEVFDPIDDETVLDLVMPETIHHGQIHDRMNHVIETFDLNSLRQLSTTRNPWPGMSSLYTDGGTPITFRSSPDFAINLQDFSFEIMFYLLNGGHGSAWARIFQIGVTGANALTVYCSGTADPATIQAQWHNGTAFTNLWTANATTIANTTWHKLQLRRKNGVFEMAINGTVWGTSATVAYPVGASTGAVIYIGGSGPIEYLKGNIGPARLSVGSRRAAQTTPTATFLKPRPQGSSGARAQIYNKVIPV